MKDNLLYFAPKAGCKLVNSGKYDKKVVCDNLDSNSYNFISCLLNHKLREADDLMPIVKTEIKPMYFFLDKEIKLFADLRGLKYKKQREDNNEWNNFVDEMEKKHPELKQAIMNSYLKLFD